jgi:excisionase family DNA binding protein
MEDRRDLLTISEMADRLKVHKSWLYRKTKKRRPGSIPRMKIGKYLRFNEAEVMAWLKGLQQETE